MTMKKTLSLAKFICNETRKLSKERREFFLLWLTDHADIEKLYEDPQMEKNLNNWFYSLSINKALKEYKLIIAEIRWCAEVPIKTLRRIASAERLDNRRSLDE
ncbi:MAG: hypothetical protein ISR59_13285 [Anaerolineales bacterium]|uniref:Uncharacterized protein n=1 Tax=Candidatus Desulfolinea nitratireducens TaxID=2841698 RepID=A0A8J6NKW5_9CHLR|nr:hypothetical protein [Candidatus Desulfolinea nitratireducens]MBL6962074.1 hypothetical protein [Anaerolineales bacterium]